MPRRHTSYAIANPLLWALDAAVGGVDGHGIWIVAIEAENLVAIAIELADKAGAVARISAPAPSHDEALIAKIVEGTTGLGEVMWEAVT